MNLPLFSKRVPIFDAEYFADLTRFDALSIKNRILNFLVQKIKPDMSSSSIFGMPNKRGRYPLPHDFKLAGIMIVEKDFNYVISNYSDDENFLNCLVNGAFPWIGEEIGKQMGLNLESPFR